MFPGLSGEASTRRGSGPEANARAREKVLVDSFASSIASSNKCLTGSNKKLVITILKLNSFCYH